MAKVVEITTHFIDEVSGISGYVANSKVYLNLGEDGVTKEDFLKSAIKYVGFNVTKSRIKTFTDIYDDAQNQYTDIKIEEVSIKSSERVGILDEVSETGGDVDAPETIEVDIAIPDTTSIDKIEDEVGGEVDIKPILEESIEEEKPVRKTRATGRRGAARKAKVKSGIKAG